MRIGIIRSAASGETLLAKVYRTENPWERTRGLLGRPQLHASQGMLIAPCKAIHTMCMRYAIDAVFLDEGLHVIKVTTNIKPFRHAGALWARAVLEMQAGAAEDLGIATGNQLLWEETK